MKETGTNSLMLSVHSRARYRRRRFLCFKRCRIWRICWMDNFTSRQNAFIEQMCESEELAAHGFRLLVKRKDLAIYFDALKEAGLFDPCKNPAPVPVAEEGYV